MNAMPPPPAAELLSRGASVLSRGAEQARFVRGVAARQAGTLAAAMRPVAPAWPEGAAIPRDPLRLAADAMAYITDAAQRSLLFWDTMREAGNVFVEHERAGCPPVLSFDFDVVLDGREFEHPVNYALVRIRVPEGGAPTDPRLRPFVIIDPRAGHGAGIGGFKDDSQVGVALERGHPVYFVIFFRDPEPGQTILDVTQAEGRFLARVREDFPDAPKPVVIGNCQGGWAAMMLGAAKPELTGPLVLNGAPLSYWAGETGRNPMRYTGGLVGGAWPALLMADLGAGRFDGANLVLNFESLSPANVWFRKYFNLYAAPEAETQRFLEFERWWGGFFLMNREEIRWIVSNLFIGDRLSRGELASEPGRSFDMRAVRSPVIVFASSGDNITQPAQALRWISDIYRDEDEIRTLGQRIIYLLHEDIGHLGIFVSGKVARREHTEIATTIEMIEAVAPGLYELVIEAPEPGEAPEARRVSLRQRSLAELRALCGDSSDARPFPAVEQISRLNSDIYDTLFAPLVRAATTQAGATLSRAMHPLRARRWALSDLNPALAALPSLAAMARNNRRPAAPDNPFVAGEKLWADAVERNMERWRDLRDAWQEVAFHSVYGGLAALGVGQQTRSRPTAPPAEDATAEGLAAAAELLRSGGYAEAVVRMLVLLARARGAVRRSRLARSDAMLKTAEPFASMSAPAREELIRVQNLLVSLAPEEAIATLPDLLPDAADRARALAAVREVAGPEEELGEAASAMLARLHEALGEA
jgi:pimeloyl-ACP methyl ester carboxylesterase